jgi:UDP-GlcNAc:undecaprenyl-phosphate GlcNAc-1-phosphate transferase
LFMNLELPILGSVAAALLVSCIIALLTTPVVKAMAHKVGAVDIPKDGRRMHNHPIPRMGGLAIFLGFLLSVLIFIPLTTQLKGILLGTVIIVVLGIFDDIHDLNAMFKFVVQIIAALIAVCSGNLIQFISNPNVFSDVSTLNLGFLAYPITVIWIVAITNAVNLIDGLDGLACGVSTISSMTMLVIALVVSEGNVAIIMAALVGACLGFLPYNLNPAKIFMGDTGSTFLGFVLATVSIQGLFKMYSIISFVVPFLMLGLPIFDISTAFIRRISKGQSPMHPDRSHVHHQLIDMGMSQKQAVATLYIISAILGLSAVVLTTSGPLKAMLLLLALCAAGAISARIFFQPIEKKQEEAEHTSEASSEQGSQEPTDLEQKEDQQP